MIHIVYNSRIEGEIVVAKFKELAEATEYMEKIKNTSPKVFPYHSILIIEDDANEWKWADSGIEEGF